LTVPARKEICHLSIHDPLHTKEMKKTTPKSISNLTMKKMIEAKSFCLSAKDGCSEFRLEEKRRGFTGVIFVSLTAASWLVDSLEEACLPLKEDFSKAFR
jgi:hypothetical protein